MSLSKNRNIPKGDYITKEEAFIDEESKIQSRCETIEEVVKDKVFTLSEALEAYEITPEQYVGYQMMSGKKRKMVVDNVIVISIAQFMLRIMDLPNSKLDVKTKRIVESMRELSKMKQ